MGHNVHGTNNKFIQQKYYIIEVDLCVRIITLIVVITHRNVTVGAYISQHTLYKVFYSVSCSDCLLEPALNNLGYSSIKYLTYDRMLTERKYSFMYVRNSPIASDFCLFVLPETLHQDSIWSQVFIITFSQTRNTVDIEELQSLMQQSLLYKEVLNRWEFFILRFLYLLQFLFSSKELFDTSITMTTASHLLIERIWS